MLDLYPLNRFASPFLAWRTVAADSSTVCAALRTAEDLSHWMPVFAYEIDFGDVSTALTGNPTGASHVGSWNLTPVVAGLDVNRQVLQNQELAYVTRFALTGNPTPMARPSGRNSSSIWVTTKAILEAW